MTKFKNPPFANKNSIQRLGLTSQPPSGSPLAASNPAEIMVISGENSLAATVNKRGSGPSENQDSDCAGEKLIYRRPLSQTRYPWQQWFTTREYPKLKKET